MYVCIIVNIKGLYILRKVLTLFTHHFELSACTVAGGLEHADVM